MEPTAPQRALPAAAGGGDDDDLSDLADRKVRFPKGKKAKYRDPSAAGGSGEAGAATEDIDSLMNPELAAVKRARRRHRREGDDAQGTANVKGFEMRYKDDANFIDDGIEIEPFNLDQEREEGYFDESGNFVEFARGNDMKDACLDNVEVDTKYAEKVQKKKDKEEEFQDLSSDDIGKIKRRIADMLEADETGESRQGDREAAIDAEMSRVNKLPANSSYAIHRMKVLNKLRHLISIKRTTSQDEELELLFASLSI